MLYKLTFKLKKERQFKKIIITLDVPAIMEIIKPKNNEQKFPSPHISIENL